MVLHLALQAQRIREVNKDRHHKSYHPYNRDNVERVRKDEEEARKAEEAADALLLHTNAEARLEALRNKGQTLSEIGAKSTEEAPAAALKKRKKGKAAEPGEKELERQLAGKGWASSGRDDVEESRATISKPAPLVETQEVNGHINFWAAEEKGIKPKETTTGNAEYLAEKKKAEEKWDSQITMYLGRPASELKPWYGESDLKNGQERKRTADQLLEMAYKDGELKKLVDPMSMMSSYLDKRDQVREYNERLTDRRSHGRYSATPQPHAALLAAPVLPLLKPKRKRGEEPAYKTFQREPSPNRRDHSSDEEDSYLPMRPPPPPAVSSIDQRATDLIKQAQSRESGEKARAQALKKAAKLKQLSSNSSSVSSTPARSEFEYQDRFNKSELRQARESRQHYRIGVGRDGRAREGRSWQQTRWDDR